MKIPVLARVILVFFLCGCLVLVSIAAPPPISNPGEFISLTEPGACPETVDPAWCYDCQSAELIFNVYETLIFFDGEQTGRFIPQLATNWTIVNITGTVSPEGLDWYYRYIFRIRGGVIFHNGNPLTPSDVEYSFERLLVQSREGGPAWTLCEPLLNVKEVEELGDLTNPIDVNLIGLMLDHAVESNATHLWFNLAFPGAYAPFLQILSQPWSSILDQQWCTSNGRPDWNGNWMLGGDHTDWVEYHDPQLSPLDDPSPIMMGCGPFEYDILDYAAKYWSIVRYENYWRGWPANFPDVAIPNLEGYVDRCTVSWAYNWLIAGPMFLAGDADFFSVPRVVMNGFLGADGVRCYFPLPMLALDAVLFNFNVSLSSPYGPIFPPGALNESGIPSDFFTDVHVRRAFAHMIDYTKYINFHYQGEGFHPNTTIIQGLPYYDPTVAGYEFNLTKAIEELQAAWGGQLWNIGFTISLCYNENSWARKHMMENLAEGIQQISTLTGNVKIHCQVIGINPWSTYLRAMRNKQLPIFALGWEADYPDPHDFAFPFYHSKGTLARFQGYSNPTMDSLIEAGIATPNGPEREAIYHDIQVLAVEDCPNIPVVVPIGRHWERDWVVGWYYNQIYGGSLSAGIESTCPVSNALYFYNLWKWYYVEEALQPSAAQPYSTRLPCDINYDGKVDMKDISATAKAFGANYGPPMHERWRFRCDISNDRKIDMKDIGTAAKNFGKTSPIWKPPAPTVHDLRAGIDVPTEINATETPEVDITALVTNLGVSDETNVNITLYIDTVMLHSEIVPFLPSKNTYSLIHTWSPVVGIHTVEVRVLPVPGETILFNNIASREVLVVD